MEQELSIAQILIYLIVYGVGAWCFTSFEKVN